MLFIVIIGQMKPLKYELCVSDSRTLFISLSHIFDHFYLPRSLYIPVLFCAVGRGSADNDKNFIVPTNP